MTQFLNDLANVFLTAGLSAEEAKKAAITEAIKAGIAAGWTVAEAIDEVLGAGTYAGLRADVIAHYTGA